MTGFIDAAQHLLRNDSAATELRLYFYAATLDGWLQLAQEIAHWVSARADRSVTAYIGTDHGLTDPDSVDAMRTAGVTVRILRRYKGVFHPKVVWFFREGAGHIIVGSNNLTFQGLCGNIEFATLTNFEEPDSNLTKWHECVHSASDVFDETLLKSYRSERDAFFTKRADACKASKVGGTFIWTKRTSGTTTPVQPQPQLNAVQAGQAIPVSKGDLVVEITPRETGPNGSQIQIPQSAVRRFFKLPSGRGNHKQVRLRNVVTADTRTLTLTNYRNSTGRLVVKELDYRDRPCVIVFRPPSQGVIDFEIVREYIDPDRYRSLIAACGPSTRVGSRRWAIL